MKRTLTLRSILFTLLAIVFVAEPAAGQSGRSLVQRLDSLAGSGVREGHAVGTVAAVVRDDDTLLFEAYGQADVEWDVPMTTDAMFEIASVTKQFTAVALLQLRDRGVFGLDDEITRWLPDFNTRGHTVTLRHLLSHTSGIADFTEMPEFNTLKSDLISPRDSAYVLLQRHPFQFAPGEMQIYNNSGVWLLGSVT